VLFGTTNLSATKSWTLTPGKMRCELRLIPTLQKSEGFRVKASRVKLYLFYRNPLTTQDLKFSGFPEG
jgi:hypothetical protein